MNMNMNMNMNININININVYLLSVANRIRAEGQRHGQIQSRSTFDRNFFSWNSKYQMSVLQLEL